MGRNKLYKGCAFEGCSKEHFSKGYCAGHYMQLQAGKEMRPLRHRSTTHKKGGATITQAIPVPATLTAQETAEWLADSKYMADGKLSTFGERWVEERLKRMSTAELILIEQYFAEQFNVQVTFSEADASTQSVLGDEATDAEDTEDLEALAREVLLLQ